jgi:hypothetical protein
MTACSRRRPLGAASHHEPALACPKQPVVSSPQLGTPDGVTVAASTRLAQPWQTSSHTPYKSSSRASDLGSEAVIANRAELSRSDI